MNVWDKTRPRLRPAQGGQARHDGDGQAAGGGHRQRRRHRRQDPAAQGASTSSSSAARTAPREWYSTMGNDLDVDARRPRTRRRPRRRPTSRSAPGTTSRRATTTASSSSSDDGGARPWDTRRGTFTGTDTDHWADVRRPYDLAAYEGKDVLVRFEYITDGGVALARLGGHRHRRRRTSSSRSPRSRPTAGSAWTASGQQTDRPLLHRRVPHPRRLRREPQELLPVEQRLHELGRLVQLQPAACTSSTATRSTWTTTWPTTSAGAAGWSSTPGRCRTASPTATARPTTWATGGRASRCATRPSASSRRRTQSIYFADYDMGWDVGEQHGSRQARPAVVQRREDVLVRRAPRGRGQDPAGPRACASGQVDERRHHDDLGRQREVTRRLTAT